MTQFRLVKRRGPCEVRIEPGHPPGWYEYDNLKDNNPIVLYIAAGLYRVEYEPVISDPAWYKIMIWVLRGFNKAIKKCGV